MDSHLKDSIVKITLLWLAVSALLTLPASCVKAVHAFHEQVILKNW